MKSEWTKRVSYENGKREALYAQINYVTRFFTRTKLQRIQRTEVNVAHVSFPGPACLALLCHGYWEARKVSHVATNGIWIVHSSRGNFDVFVDEDRVHFQGNDTLFGAPWHSYRPEDKYSPGCTLSEICIKPKSFTPNGNLTLGDWSRISKEDQQVLGKVIANPRSHILHRESALRRLMLDLIEEYEQAAYGLTARACALIDRILIELVHAEQRDPGEEQVIPRRIRNLLSRIESSLDQSWTREEMLALAGCGPASLTQWFRRAVGFSPMRYVVHLRVLQARALLAGSDESITAIAHRLNFSSSQHFATVFRRQVGMTPTEYRDRMERHNPA